MNTLTKQTIIDTLNQIKTHRLNCDDYLMISENMIKGNWEGIKSDPYNNRPDIETPEEYISECKKGNVTAGGKKIILD